MRKLMNRLAVVAVIGIPTIAGVVISAGPAGAATAVRAVVVRHASPDAIPNSTIKGNGKKAKFNPKELTVAEDTSGDMCSTDVVSFTITNKGKKTQYVTFNGSPLFSLPKKSVGDICLYGGSSGAMATIGLSNSTNTVTYKGTLTITASN